MNLQEIKDFLKNNSQYYSDKNDTPIEKIKAGTKYYFISNCGHEFHSLPKNVIHDNKIGCPICAGRVVVKGINDFNTIHPELSKYLYDYNDGYKYTEQSNKEVRWRCPYCSYEWTESFNKMVVKVYKCKNCGYKGSYSERIMATLLDWLYIPYKSEAKFDWSGDKRYDFYLPEYNTIIEMHGKQHYSASLYPKGSYEFIREEMNDEIKCQLACENGIANYVVIDASVPDFDWIKTNICNSILPTLLFFSPKDINWSECEKYATDNIIRLVCNDYENGMPRKELESQYKKSKNTIKKYLKIGAKLGWCNYDAKKSKEESSIENGRRIVEQMSMPVNQIDPHTGAVINTYPSLQEAQRSLGVSHIWDCIHGRRKTAKGYKWEYVNKAT